MTKTNLNINKQFMIGNGILAFAVIFVVVIFVYMSMRLSGNKTEQAYAEIYSIELSSGFVGDSVSIYVNDSLLLNKTITTDSIHMKVKRFAEQSAILVVDNLTERISAFDLDEKGGAIHLKKEDGTIYFSSN